MNENKQKETKKDNAGSAARPLREYQFLDVFHTLLPQKAQLFIKREVDRARTTKDGLRRQSVIQGAINRIQAFSELTLNENTLGMSDASVPVGESSPNAKYSNHDIRRYVELHITINIS